jgi:hypothetical protein
MAGMRWRLFTICSALSLLLCVATAIVWPWSLFYSYRLEYPHGTAAWKIQNGSLEYDSLELYSTGTQAISFYTPGRLVMEDTPLLIWPFWRLFLASIPLPLIWIKVRRAQVESRRRRGLCRSCGYDLRATPDRCPECGAVPAARC